MLFIFVSILKSSKHVLKKGIPNKNYINQIYNQSYNVINADHIYEECCHFGKKALGNRKAFPMEG